MEVHPPEHAIHSWRDFFIHIATITIGLLIAIGLEQTVEWFHHRHLIHQAREQLQDEIAENRRTLHQDQRILADTAAHIRRNIDILDDLPKNKASHDSRLNVGWTFNGFAEAAWQTARDTGAISLMPYREVQEYAQTYGQQSLVSQNAEAYIQIYVRSLAPLSRHGNLSEVSVTADHLTLAQREQLAANSAEALTQIGLVLDLLRGLDKNYAATLAPSHNLTAPSP